MGIDFILLQCGALIFFLFSYRLYRKKDRIDSKYGNILGLTLCLLSAIITMNWEFTIFLVIFITLKVLELIQLHKRKKKQLKNLRDGEKG